MGKTTDGGRYRCGWCGHRGVRIGEQVAEVVLTVAPPVRRFVCWVCGNEVWPQKGEER